VRDWQSSQVWTTLYWPVPLHLQPQLDYLPDGRFRFSLIPRRPAIRSIVSTEVRKLQAQPKGESNRGHTKAVRQALAILAGVDNFMLAGSPSPSASARLFGGWPLSFQLNPQTSGHSLDRFNRGSQARGSFLQRG